MTSDPTFFLRKIRHPKNFAAPKIEAVFSIAVNAITATAARKDYNDVYAEYLNRITDMIDVMAGFEDIAEEDMLDLATAVFAGTAMDYVKSSPEQTTKAIANLDLRQDPRWVRMVDWALEREPFAALNDRRIIITTAWLLNDSENYAEYLFDMPDELKAMMKRVHTENYANTSKVDLPNSVTTRLRPALTKILTL